MRNDLENVKEQFKMICTPISAENSKEATKKINYAIKIGADLIEIRLDYFKFIDINEIKELIKTCQIPIIITLRKTDEGGHYKYSEEKRVSLLEKIIELKPEYVDIEYSTPTIRNLLDMAKRYEVKTIISYHNFLNTPDLNDLRTLLLKIEAFDGNVSKIITKAKNIDDNLKILSLIKFAKKKIVTFAMGVNGILSRIFSPLFGSFFTFASLDNLTAPGQINIKDMKQILKYYSIILERIKNNSKNLQN
ncbi:MAG: type I 3-dehydroquinate dehydratase [Candidatus Helarchaeota archaeon]